MNPELDPSLLAELRELHQSERATAELERSVLARLLPSRGKAPFGARVRAWRSRRTVLGATLGMAAAGALYLGSRAFSVEPSRVFGPEPRLEAAVEARKAAGAARAGASAARCPLDALPPGSIYDPTRMEPEMARAGLQLDTFAMPIPGCPELVRRTLSYVPRGLVRGPVLLVLHDGGDSAEGVRALQTGGSFEELAERRHGPIVVYANAAPASGRFLHSGFWQTDPGANRAIDDFAYLARIVERLGERVGPGGRVYLIGYGSGAQLALEAAARHPERYVGVAAILPDEVNHSRPPPYRSDTRLSRLLFVTLEEARPGAPWVRPPLKLEEWQVTVGLQYLAQRHPPLVQPAEDRAPGPITSEEEASLLARRVVPAGTRVFDSWFPDVGAPGWRVVVVPSKAAVEVGPGGSPAPVDAATLAWEFFQRAVPGYVGAAGP